MPSFFERLEERCKAVDSILCVGLDPHRQDLEKLGDVTAEGAYTFATNLIDQTKHIAVAYKPNAAFFEALGADGVNALARGEFLLDVDNCQRVGNMANRCTVFLLFFIFNWVDNKPATFLAAPVFQRLLYSTRSVDYLCVCLHCLLTV